MSSSFNTDLLTLIPRLRAFARSLTRDPDAADDLVQDTVTRTLRKRHLLVPGTNLSAWTFTIMRNLHVSAVRRRRPQAALSDEDVEATWSVMPRQDKRLEVEDFERAMAVLSPEHRNILMLIGAAGFTYEDAASVCGCAVGTIKSRLSRARRELARLLNGGVSTRGAIAPRHRLIGARVPGPGQSSAVERYTSSRV